MSGRSSPRRSGATRVRAEKTYFRGTVGAPLISNKFFLGAALLACIVTTAQGQPGAHSELEAPGNTIAQSSSAEQSAEQQSFQLKVQSNLVLVRVVVRDKAGNPVRGLKKGDFRLFDKGKEQTISQFEEVPSAPPSAQSPARSTLPVASTATATPPARSEQRYVAFYFDEFNSSEADLIQARDAADRYLATGLQPNDHIAIFTAEKMLSDFTSDPHRIHVALMQLHASSRGPANEHLCPDLSDYQAYQILQSNDMESDAWRVAIAEARSCPVTAFSPPSNPSMVNSSELQPIRMLAQRIVDQAQDLTRANLQQCEKVVKYIAEAPGQRSIVLVSPGFLSQSEQYTLDRIIDRALHDQVVINSLDPKGLALLLRESDASANTTILPDPRATQARFHLDASKEFVGADVLAEMAQGTGGEFFHSDNDLKAGFAALTEEPSHYILAFTPRDVKWDGKFHPLKVTFTAKEKGRTIQARRGYFAVQNPPSEQVATTNNPPKSEPASGSTREAVEPPVPPQPKIAAAGAIPQPSVAAPALGPMPAYSSAADVHPEESTAPASVPTPPAISELPIDAIGRTPMPDPTQGLIRVDVTVTDKDGKRVSGLSKEDFKLLDNGQQEKIVTFQSFGGAGAAPAAPVEVIFVMDELNMLPSAHAGKQELSAAYREVENVLRAHGGFLENPTMIYRLSANGLYATTHASIDGNALAAEIENPGEQRQIWSPSMIAKDVEHIARGGDVGVRITQSIIALGSISIEERRKPGRKLMFWMGNGWQIEDRRAAELLNFSVELLTRMREARINLWGASEWPLYDASGNAVAVTEDLDKEFLHGPKPDSIDLRYLSLPVIAARSGGGMLDVPRNLAARIAERVKEEGNYYSITFDPPPTSVVDEYHHLQMELAKTDVTAHVFQDYYDQPVFYDQPRSKQPLTVKQLEDTITNAQDTSGSDLAHQLDGMQLTERLSSARLAKLEKLAHGGKVREALETMADEATFLAPPAYEILATPPPDIALQQQIVSRIVSYVNTTIPSLPDLFATRATVQYHEPEAKPGQTWKTAFRDRSLHEGETVTASIHFHDGKELVRALSVKHAPDTPGREHLETFGTFGPILATVMRAATSPHSKMKWARWEQSENGQLAVFRYRVPEPTSFFTAEFCCMAYDFDSIPFKQPAPFHGEITVNPSTGAIMRLTIQADLAWRLPLERSDVMVEYAPVTRGPRTFICPVKSVSISRQRRTVAIDEWGESFRVYGPFETLLNQMRFERYRIFGSTYRILPDFTEVPAQK